MDHLTRLVVAAGRGDVDALERFVSETQADVWRLCAHLGDRRDADDLAQETYERAIGSIHRFRGEGSARSWLFGIARRVCADHVRRSQRHRRRWHAAADAAAVDQRITAGVDLGGDRVELDELLGLLDPDRRDAFVLTQVLGLHYDEAAEVIGCPIGTIRSRVARARLDLAEMIERADARAADRRTSLRSTGTDRT